MEPPSKKQRVRSKNFSLTEIEVLKSSVIDCFHVISSKHCNGSSAVTKRIQDQAWMNVCKKVNSVGVANRSVTEIKEKWRNLTKKAKTEVTQQKRSMSQTGGGPPIPLADPMLEEIAGLFQGSASFHGIPGAGDAETTLLLTSPAECVGTKNTDFQPDLANTVCTSNQFGLVQDSGSCITSVLSASSHNMDFLLGESGQSDSFPITACINNTEDIQIHESAESHSVIFPGSSNKGHYLDTLESGTRNSLPFSANEQMTDAMNANCTESVITNKKRNDEEHMTSNVSKNQRSLKDLQMEYYKYATIQVKEKTKLIKEKTTFYSNLNAQLPKMKKLLDDLLKKVTSEEEE